MKKSMANDISDLARVGVVVHIPCMANDISITIEEEELRKFGWLAMIRVRVALWLIPPCFKAVLFDRETWDSVGFVFDYLKRESAEQKKTIRRVH